jgi:uncharacterized membrane protein YsdA (DUF1294 family)
MKAQGSRAEWSRFGPLNFAFWLPVAFLLFLGFGALGKHLPHAIPLAYATCSLLSVAFYARDKSKARRDAWRTPESVLHFLDLIGGWPGGLIAQRVFRHKTRKLSFQVIFWLCVAAHVITWSWIFVAVPAEVDFFRFVKQVAGAAKTAFER